MVAVPKKPFVLGLDWANKKDGWAYCALTAASGRAPQLGCLALDQVPKSDLVRNATCIVIDIPIGLSDVKREDCASRECDCGARRWVGSASSSVFAPPVIAELANWQRRRHAAEPQRRGHSFSLLAAIHSADEVRSRNPRTLESHPELVFTAVTGRAFPPSGRKKLLVGLLARAALLQRQGIKINLSHLVGLRPIPTDNYLDAMAMALVARSWQKLGDDLRVIRRDTGIPERLGDHASRDFLMALPEEVNGAPGQAPLRPEALLALAAEFTP